MKQTFYLKTPLAAVLTAVLTTAALAAVLSFTACASQKAGGEDARAASYIRTWPLAQSARQSGSIYWSAGMVKGEYLNNLIVSFALLDSADVSSIYIPELRPLQNGEPMFTNLWDEVKALKKKYPHLKVTVSVGGYGAEGFSDLASDAKLRAKFASNVCGWLKDYNLDGVDIDWEYPVGPEWGQPIKSRPEDKTNYIALLEDLRAAMDKLGESSKKRYSLSAAVPASGWFVKANDAVKAASIVDALKLMAYDYYGAWSKQTGHDSNLYNNPADPEWGGWSTDQALKAYLDAGVPRDKIMLGVAFYGHGWSGVKAGPDAAAPGLFQPYTGVLGEEGALGWIDIEPLTKPGSGYTRYWDDKAKSPFLYNGDVWISYTDEEKIAHITQYAKEEGLAGVFVWEYGHDVHGSLFKPLAEGLK